MRAVHPGVLSLVIYMNIRHANLSTTRNKDIMLRECQRLVCNKGMNTPDPEMIFRYHGS